MVDLDSMPTARAKTVNMFVQEAVHPHTPVPGAECPGSRLPEANIRCWRETPFVGPVVAEAAMRLDVKGYVSAAWSCDAEAHAVLSELMEHWVRTEVRDEPVHWTWIPLEAM